MSENMGSKNYSSEDLNAEMANLESLSALDAQNSTEELKKGVLAYLAAVQPKSGEGQEKTDAGQEKTDAGQEKQLQEKPLSREIVEQVLAQLADFPSDDAYIATLVEKHANEEQVAEIVSLREATRQRHLEVYKAVLEKAIEKEASAQTNAAGNRDNAWEKAITQMERITEWLSSLDMEDFDQGTWEMIQERAFGLMDQATIAAAR